MLHLSPTRLLPVLLLAAAACSAPRAVIHSGKVTPKGEFKIGGDFVMNVGNEALSQATGAVKDLAEKAATQDTVNYRPAIDRVQAAALAYVLDPVQLAPDLYLRYGVANRVDVGYKYSFGAHSLDAMYQFLGPTGTPERPGGQAGATYASIGLQLSAQRAKLPSIPFLDDAEQLLGFRARRYDIMVPLVFSQSLGAEEEIGHIAYGLAYTRSFLTYRFEPGRLYTGPGSGQVSERIPAIKASQSFGALGGFVNAKFGYRYVYVLPALAVYYQNYGTYQLLNNRTAQLKGFTFIPSLGLQIRIPGSGR
ncbi:hypothetical protein D3Y59_09220 [Hymenobacter oligotrophus]|uniref:Outer membrane protein beta-barrel domain-containing protein n=1 Tax=Hymenobacter oligotrophus TaxID=2319843 RepID=A0A3B7QZZ5_9BACT|nr:hypothetical protein [Hymenobacter oligotrophus]AYA37215.1 hypothetical protein D3Y59_09220 [Hymenobacter oligotrophus]